MEMSILNRLIVIIGISAISIVADQWSKSWATHQLKPTLQEASKSHFSYLGDTFRLTFVKNRGAFLSLGSTFSETFRYWALKVFPVLLLIGLILHMLFSQTLTWWQLAAFSFILGGGLSNIYDRLLYESVVDFMNMGFGVIFDWIGINDIRTGIFNIADVSIMTGLFMMLPSMFSKKPDSTPLKDA